MEIKGFMLMIWIMVICAVFIANIGELPIFNTESRGILYYAVMFFVIVFFALILSNMKKKRRR